MHRLGGGGAARLVPLLLSRWTVAILALGLGSVSTGADALCVALQNAQLNSTIEATQATSPYLQSKIATLALQHPGTFQMLNFGIDPVVEAQTSLDSLVFQSVCIEGVSTSNSVAIARLTSLVLAANVANSMASNPTLTGLSGCVHPRDPVLMIDTKQNSTFCACGRADCSDLLCEGNLAALSVAVFIILQFLHLRGTFYKAVKSD